MAGLCRVIFISGPPASGKTFIAKRLSDELNIPLISKDAIKEGLFDKLGESDREWSKKIGSASFKLLLMLSNELFSKGTSFIVESAFRAGDEQCFQIPYDKYTVTQLWCNANDDVLLLRFRERALSGLRHSGHQDHLNLPELEGLLENKAFKPLDLAIELVSIDTNNFASQFYQDAYEAFRDSHLAGL